MYDGAHGNVPAYADTLTSLPLTCPSSQCLDRWVQKDAGERACLIWEGNEPHQQRTMSYAQVLRETCRLVGDMLVC